MISFTKYKLLYLIISSLVLIPGIFSIIVWGFKPAIDFVGGSLIEYSFNKDVSKDRIEQFFKEENIRLFSVAPSTSQTYLIKTEPISEEKKKSLIKNLEDNLSLKVEEKRFETVGPILGRELLVKTIVAALLASFAIMFYVAWAFKNLKYGTAAVIALFHDLFILLGTFSLLGHFLGVEVDGLFVTAVLTTMSFSVHDTIVVFDRIRESVKKFSKLDFDSLANKALTETMARSINNSLTIIFMLLALLLLGGETIKWFVFALLVGTISGTYSSPFIATPILTLFYKKTQAENR